MKGQEFIIAFKDDLAFLTEEVALDLQQVDISSTPVKFKAPAYWRIRVVNHIEKENRLFVEVLSYHVGETRFPPNQIQLADTLITIERVTFKSIDTTGLLQTLHGNRPVTVKAPKPDHVYRSEPRMIAPQPIMQSFTETFTVPIKDITFINGGVTFEKKLKQLKAPIQFHIPNEYIIAEFDAVKNYFASVLKTKRIEVVTSIVTVDGVMTETKVSSGEIDRIDNSVIHEVKLAFVKGTRSKEPSTDTEIFTMEEYFETFNEPGAATQPFFPTDEAFVDELLGMSDTKHYRHLRYLSGKHRHDLEKLRFIQKPFSFIFLLGNTETVYFIWETLDTEEATYVWSTPNEPELIKDLLFHINSTIKLIREQGKNEYIRRNEENFTRVYHDYSDEEMGFEIWKAEMQRVIK